MIRNEFRNNGDLVEVHEIEDDGTCTITRYEKGVQVGTEMVQVDPPPPLTPLERLQLLPAPQAEAILTLAGGLVARAGEIWHATYDIPSTDPAKEPLRVVAEVALTAALPLLDS